MNKIFMIGNLTKDPELNKTASGISYCKFDIAVNRPFKEGDKQTVDFFHCTVWREAADNLCKFQKKGSKISIVGCAVNKEYENKEKVKCHSFDLIVNEIEYLTSKAKADSSDTEECPY